MRCNYVMASCLGVSLRMVYAVRRKAREETKSMDFFETQEHYRRREMRGWMTLIVRAALIGGSLWLCRVRGPRRQTKLTCAKKKYNGAATRAHVNLFAVTP